MAEEKALMDDNTVVRATTSAELPQDLLREIVSRLPGKSMVRFNCVSKLWSYSLTVTAFLLRHSRSPTASPGVYHAFLSTEEPPLNWNLQLFSFRIQNDHEIIRSWPPMPLPTLPPIFAPWSLNVSNFCDGLVCVFNWHDPSKKLPVLLCSPRILDFSALPITSLCLPPPHSSRLHWCLLGFDPTRGEYRILRSINREGDTRGKYCIEYEILTVGSKSWKRIDHADVPSSICAQGFTGASRGIVCLNGVIYWLHWNSHEDIVLASIDLASEEFGTFRVNQLNGFSCDINDYYLAPLKGHLTLFVSDRNKRNNAWQWTFSDLQNSTPICHRRIFPSPIHSVRENYPQISGTTIQRRLDYRMYYCYDVENGSVDWIIKTLRPGELLKIG